jgi:hypothetical protein
LEKNSSQLQPPFHPVFSILRTSHSIQELASFKGCLQTWLPSKIGKEDIEENPEAVLGVFKLYKENQEEAAPVDKVAEETSFLSLEPETAAGPSAPVETESQKEWS